MNNFFLLFTRNSKKNATFAKNKIKTENINVKTDITVWKTKR